jgi:hypothetical protein
MTRTRHRRRPTVAAVALVSTVACDRVGRGSSYAAALDRAPDGTCRYTMAHEGCPRGAMCNPPPPIEVECPDAAVVTPPGHTGWLRVRPALYATRTSGGCQFMPEYWCPPARSTEHCDTSRVLRVPCTYEASDGGRRVANVAPFSYEVSPGRCACVSALRCEVTTRCDVEVSACACSATLTVAQ